MKYYLDDEIKEPKVLVVTPSIQSSTLEDAIQSVKNQDYGGNLEHLVVYDGKPIKNDNRVVEMSLPWNTGGNGFYGHRIYSMIGHISNHDFILFLDEDNTYESDHVSSCMETIQSNGGYHFVHSYRNVMDKQGKFVCRDRFEALGTEPIQLIDTSTYCFTREILIFFGHYWHHGWGADRRFFQMINNVPNIRYTATGKWTANYRLDGNEGSPSADFFKQGNVKHGFTADGLGELNV